MKLFFAVLLSTPLFIESQEVDAGDILFLKVQELEGEISALRSELGITGISDRQAFK